MKYLTHLLLALATTTFCSAQERTLPKEIAPRIDNKLDQASQMLMPTSKLLGTNVKDSDGEVCGEISSFVFDNSGQVHYVILGVGGVAGVGESLVALPWSAFQCKCTMADGKMTCHPTVSMPTKQLSSAPLLKGKDYVELTDANWAAKNASFFRVDKPTSPISASTMVCTSKVIDTTVKSGAESVGDLDELVVQNGSGQIKFAVVGFGGLANVGKTYVALPFKSLKFASKEDKTAVNVTETPTQVQAATKVTPNEYPELNLKSVAERTGKVQQ